MDDISRNALARARGALDVVAAGPGQSAGRSVGRLIRSLAMSDDMDAAAAFIEAQNWVEKDAIGRVMKAAVPGLHLGSLPADTITADFMAALRPYAVLSRLDKARRVPTKTRVIAFGAGAAAFRVGERKPIPISRASLVGIQIDSKPKVAGVSLATRELLAVPGIETDIALGLDLAAATGAAEDAVFLDPTVTGSILNGAPTAVSVGVNTTGVDADLQKAIELLLAAGGDLRDAAWVLSPAAAAKVAGLRGTGGAASFPGIGPNGGELLGLPALTSATAAGKLILIDQSGIIVDRDAGAEITRAESATLQLSDAPTEPPTAPEQLVSLFQTDAVAIKAVLHRGWAVRAGSVATYITGGTW
ncbi:phage major capsid protein [Alicycliphilus denitrificans]|uniref:Phage capsid-like C-terminal domain-containing protein n=2 Tax=Alicycliphilus denitrificans TaxID=179636 RepID=F4GG63_ALIDK|nr:phage major capsid protein [Alicycliphilus denitrificans]AEB82847.1 hypothetical protein Alide2_0425 [Alicycliphilus denitrificans K601]QKD43065.1 phage major capsid protein [Alicycliphilus denitrificans]